MGSDYRKYCRKSDSWDTPFLTQGPNDSRTSPFNTLGDADEEKIGKTRDGREGIHTRIKGAWNTVPSHLGDQNAACTAV